MSKKRIPHGFISKKDYPLGQFGGCSSMYGTGPQSGGFAVLPAIAAVYAGLKTVQPFSKAKKALEENVGEKGKASLGYKIAHKVSSIGSSLGFGQNTGINTGIAEPITYSRGVYQPITGVNRLPRKQGTGKKKARKSRAKKHKTAK